MKKEFSALEAKVEAQRLAFAPIYFQAVIAMMQLGVLELLRKNKKGIKISELATQLNLTEYGVNVLLEAGAHANVVDYLDDETVVLTKVGFMINADRMTEVNFNFVNDVCYTGAKHLTESIKTGKPEGLKTLGNWNTVYEGLMQLPEQIKTSWLEFDHYYSDDAFDSALKIVFQDKPNYIFDIGGNTGKWAMACCKFSSDVRVKMLDLPPQLAVAKNNIEAKGFTNRVDFHPINILDTNQKVPQGADAIWMSQFLDCFADNEIVSILKNVSQAASEHTNIYIMEPFIDNQKYASAAYCLVGTSIYFTTIANGNSKMYSIKQMEKLVEQAGLKVVQTFALINDSHQTILKCAKA